MGSLKPMIYIDFIHPLTGHSDCMIILKSAAYFALTNEELEEILSSDNEPVLRLMWLVCSWRPAVSGSLSCQLRPRQCSRMTFFILQLLIQSCRLILARVLKSAVSISMLALYLNMSYMTYLTYFAFQLGWQGLQVLLPSAAP